MISIVISPVRLLKQDLEAEKCFGCAADLFEELEDVKRSVMIRNAQGIILKRKGKFERSARVLEIRAMSFQTMYGEQSIQCAKPFRDVGIMWRRAGDSVRALRSLRLSRNIYVMHDGSRSAQVRKLDIEIQLAGNNTNTHSSCSSSDDEEDSSILASYNVDLDTSDYK